jgi:hypothetical protein
MEIYNLFTRTYGSLTAWVSAVPTWKATRNKRECQTLARMFDMAAGQGLDLAAWDFVEVGMRRLAAILEAETSGWHVAQHMEEAGCSGSVLLPQGLRKAALKLATRDKKINAKAGSAATRE